MLDIKTQQNQSRIMEVLRTFLKLGLTSFGGPVAHIGYFRKELVERRAWVCEAQFSQLLAICQFLPGPASSQLGFALGLLRGGWLGALIAFLAFTLPSAVLLMGFAAILPLLSGELAQGAIHGVKLVACVVVADAVIGMATKLCPDLQRRVLAILSAIALLLVGSVWMQIGLVLLGAMAGLVLCKQPAIGGQSMIRVNYGKRFAVILLGIFALLLALALLLPSTQGVTGIAQVFYQAGALVFGGGHVVLPLLEESVVAAGWLSGDTFLAGYGASQAIPGPMFAFAAYLGALLPTEHAPWVGASIALVFMFLPGFLLIAAILPLWQQLVSRPRAVNAIAGVNAVVVGILAAALYDPILTSGLASWSDWIIVIIGFALLFRFKCSALIVVAWCVITGMAMSMLA